MVVIHFWEITRSLRRTVENPTKETHAQLFEPKRKTFHIVLRCSNDLVTQNFYAIHKYTWTRYHLQTVLNTFRLYGEI